ncbi:hypothetical protein L1049_003612 [Liquidambar formosana]|uniref:Bifunctional inhibitor/plant lipid transfer protein/seed storage helical domain-containing protein n=1 Tax=Liquidambar formosana TaxID=63359 RepID=A0AAP0RM75_LIQFO
MEMGKKIVILVVVMVAMLQGSRGLSLCGVNEDGLMACKPSVTKPDPVEPSPECCEAISGADLTCLCSYKNSVMLPALGIDPDLAMELPAKCNLTPPTEC